MRKTFITALFLILAAHTALAIPTLQVDIVGGFYDPITETIITNNTTGVVTVLAILTPTPNNASNHAALLADTYYISSALSPEPASAGDYGSFDFEGTTLDVTDDMIYGTPPLDALEGFHDPGDLANHGIFPTYFYEHEFQFDPNNTTARYNSQDNPGGYDPSGSGAYYAEFEVNVADLDSEFNMHFDLYSSDVKTNGDIDVDDFAPFSHDGEIRQGPGPGGPGPGGPGPGGPGPGIPEPGTLTLLVGGLALLAKRRRSSDSK